MDGNEIIGSITAAIDRHLRTCDGELEHACGPLRGRLSTGVYPQTEHINIVGRACRAGDKGEGNSTQVPRIVA